MSDKNEVPAAQDDSDPKAAGARLRAARDSQGLRIDTVAEALGLSTSVIAKLESDDYESLAAPVYVRGYIRKYARFLDLPEDDLVAAYEVVSTPREPQLSNPMSRDLEHRGGRRWLTAVAILLLVVVMVAAAVWAWRYVRHGQEVTRIPPSAAASAAPAFGKSALVAAPIQTRNQAALAPASLAPSGKAAPAADSGAIVAPTLPGTGAIAADHTPARSATVQSGEHRLILHVHTTSWIEVMAADHTRLYYDLAPSGTTLDFTGRHGALQVFLGNAPGVDVLLNGQPYSIPDSRRSGNTARFTVRLKKTASAADRS
ncbi:MAG: DUF4115 domain-containing protein [Gammaproteobacteria bacterium]|nr:DUF4115 domain-containing protein [Gammaproteobacteria bacterium]